MMLTPISGILLGLIIERKITAEQAEAIRNRIGDKNIKTPLTEIYEEIKDLIPLGAKAKYVSSILSNFKKGLS